MHADFNALQHTLITPTHAWTGIPTYNRDESLWTNAIGKTRIHVERMFRRAQEWKILHSLIKISQMDLAGTVFIVCMYLTNFESPLIREQGRKLTSLARLQWEY